MPLSYRQILSDARINPSHAKALLESNATRHYEPGNDPKNHRKMALAATVDSEFRGLFFASSTSYKLTTNVPNSAISPTTAMT